MGFRPCTVAQATTQALVVGTAASSITLAFAPSGVLPADVPLLLFADGPASVFVSFTGPAVIPVAGTPSEGVWIPAGFAQVVTPPHDATTTLSAIALGTGTTLYVTQGSAAP
ncbi:MAG: hypothetical protein ACYCOR_13665 [Acidobacteriaceae bacterium]